MFKLLKVRPFTTKICLECMNYAEEKYLKIIKNTTCGVKNPKFIESTNMDYDLKKLESSSDRITTYNIINTINFCDFDDFSD